MLVFVGDFRLTGNDVKHVKQTFDLICARFIARIPDCKNFFDIAILLPGNSTNLHPRPLIA